MKKLNSLATRFGNTESPEQVPPIIEEVDELFIAVMLWEPPACAQDLQINVGLAIGNIAGAMNAIMADDPEGFERNYGTYVIAVEMMDQEYEKLLDMVDQ